MVKAEDIKNGQGYKKEKPYNSILPYLRQKEAERKEKLSVQEGKVNANTTE